MELKSTRLDIRKRRVVAAAPASASDVIGRLFTTERRSVVLQELVACYTKTEVVSVYLAWANTQGRFRLAVPAQEMAPRNRCRIYREAIDCADFGAALDRRCRMALIERLPLLTRGPVGFF